MVTQKEHIFKSSENQTVEKKVPQQVCPKCGKKFGQNESTCPFCGNTAWGIHITRTVVGIIAVPVAVFFIIRSIDKDGIVMDKPTFFLSFVGGFLGIVMLFRGITSLRHALKIRKKLLKK